MALSNDRISIVTPVYNGAPYIEDCIQSVLDQSCEDFEYIIADNCSTDATKEIATQLAANDHRVKYIENEDHVGPIQNWNRSLQHVSDQTEFIKFVHADDWLFPNCVERMLAVLDANASVGLVSAYRLEEDKVSLDKLPSQAPCLPGVDTWAMNGQAVVRAILMEQASILGSPTAFMFRKSLVGTLDQMFSTEFLHADKEMCLRVLPKTDFGFIQQVLTFTRRHNESVTSLTNTLDTRRQENLLFLEKYGPENLSDVEFSSCKEDAIDAYYRFLARNVGSGQGDAFWRSHAKVLNKVRRPYSKSKLLGALARQWLNPGKSLRELRRNRAARRRAATTDQTQAFLKKNRNLDTVGLDDKVSS